MEPSWAKLGPSWGQVGAKLGQVGPSWVKLGQVGPSWAQVGVKMGKFEPSWSQIGSSCRPSCAKLALPQCHFESKKNQSLLPKSDSNVQTKQLPDETEQHLK